MLKRGDLTAGKAKGSKFRVLLCRSRQVKAANLLGAKRVIILDREKTEAQAEGATPLATYLADN